ncbi:(Fe-S)-binding protein [Shouchella sp. 1P09AA]|uniref:(Fe-S)-binding protein n=1 Tax=unclassified Shouchella TaxID=2893065 RepID=UPI00399F2906
MNQQVKDRVQEGFKERMDYDELLNCMRCGFCLPSCPTYIESGKNELHSPRGRIALMKGVVDGDIEPDEEVKRSLDMCLGCRACEPVCPSGVKYGHLLEEARDIIYQEEKQSLPVKGLRHLVFAQLFPYQQRMVGLMGLVRFYQQTGVQSFTRKLGVLKAFPETMQIMEHVLPPIPKRKDIKNRPTQLKSLHKTRKKQVAFFSGCLMDTVFMQTNEATKKLLQYAGCDIVIPKTQACCGALHGHSGEKERAKEMAKRNIIAFEEASVDYIITNAGGCGAFLVDYDHLLKAEPEWAQRAQAFTAKIKDVTAILVELDFHKQPLQLDDEIVTYQDSCHLRNGQKTFKEPRLLLQSIQGATYVEMNNADRCCGSAGIYNMLEPKMSMQILDYKMTQTKQTKAQTIVTANPGCLLQMMVGIEKHGDPETMRAVHIVDLLLEAVENARDRQEKGSVHR